MGFGNKVLGVVVSIPLVCGRFEWSYFGRWFTTVTLTVEAGITFRVMFLSSQSVPNLGCGFHEPASSSCQRPLTSRVTWLQQKSSVDSQLLNCPIYLNDSDRVI